MAELLIKTSDVLRDSSRTSPNVTNQGELLALMDETRTLRRSWIKQEHPTITEILKQYPRLQDMPEAVCATSSKI